jgi:hypothetical protein
MAIGGIAIHGMAIFHDPFSTTPPFIQRIKAWLSALLRQAAGIALAIAVQL